MRLTLPIAVFLGIVALPWTAQAQTYPANAVLKVDTEVRSGPSDKMYPTSKLKAGASVQVLRESPDPAWLAIVPPTSSFSWINAKYVKQANDPYGVVDGDPTVKVPIMPGSTLVNQEPNVKGLDICGGSIIILVNRPLAVGGETWLPIVPHPGEVRYIPTTAIRPPVVVATAGPPNWKGNGGTPTDPRLVQAQQAVNKGDHVQGQRLLNDVAATSADPASRNAAQAQLMSLQRSLPGQPGAMQQNPNIAAATRVFSPTGPTAPPGSPVTTGTPAWSAYGTLRSTTIDASGQPIYALEDRTGHVIYVTTPPGKSLQNYVGKVITVYGATTFSGDSASRQQYIVATHLASAPGN